MEDMETEAPKEDNVNDNSSDNNGETDCENDNEMVEGEDKQSDEENDVPADKNSSKDESDNEDKDDEDNEEEVGRAEVKSLQAELEKFPYDYTTYLALIPKLRAMGELEDLRAVREKMNTHFPLSSDIWIAWLQDEMKIATTPEERATVTELCERAVKEYLSVEVWLEYLQFSIGSLGTGNTERSIRQLFERALTSAGLHLTQGALIWEAFREFEVVLTQMIDPSKETERKEQLDHVANLFRRQLACPLLEMEKTLEEFETWRDSDGADVTIDEKIVYGGYERALKKLAKRLPFEDQLVTKNEKLDVYYEYLEYEKKNGDPGRVTVLYERAVADFSLSSCIWTDYLTYLEDNIKIESIIEPVYKRAVRSVTWCGEIWKKWLRSLEKWGRPLQEVQKLVEDALSAGVSTVDEYRNIWIWYVEYLRRRIDRQESSTNEKKLLEIIRSTFNRACESLAELYGLEGDPNCEILRYWARIEAIYANDMDRARSLWRDILSQDLSSTAASWLECIALERCYGNTKHLRKLYQKALAVVKDWPESIATSWVDFERDVGTLAQMEYCEAKTKEKLTQVAKEREKAQQSFSPESTGHSNKRGKKRKLDEGQWKNLYTVPSKQTKQEKSLQPKLQGKSANFDNKRSTSSTEQASTSRGEATKPKIAPPPGFKPPEDEKMESDQAHEVDDKITVFVSNLDYTATEDEVKEALSLAGPITFVRLIRDYKGRNKGFGYVQFDSSANVDDALKLDRTPIKGRPMFVSRCDPDKTTRESGFKYACTLEKNKLFVKGLPVSMTKEGLETLFGSYGSLKDVRLVTYRNGHSKGLAYVDFANDADAGKALLATDGTTVEDKVISVAISKPPERKKGLGQEVSLAKSLGGTSISRHAFGVPKTVLSMIPRNVKPVAKNGTSIAPGNGVKQPLSNQDFREMLVNKK